MMRQSLSGLTGNTDQKQPSDIPSTLWDVLIVGAGPAGSMTASHLASHGHKVLLIDKEAFPREKVCGDGLVSDSIECLKSVGLLEAVCAAGNEMDRASVFSPSRISFSIPGKFITLRRIILDALLTQKATEVGAVFCQGEVRNIALMNSGNSSVFLADCQKQVNARIVVIATGARISLPKKLDIVSRISPSGVAVRCYVQSSYCLDHIIGSYDRSIIPGYGWIFPMGKNIYNIGIISFRGRKRGKQVNIRKSFHAFISEFPPAKDIMRYGRVITPLRGDVLRCGLKGSVSYVDNNILVVGEAVGTTLPFTGEGIGKAMESGEIAAGVIHKAIKGGDYNALNEYPVILEKRLRPRYFGYEVAEKWLSKGWLNDLIARRVTKSRFLHNAVVGIIREENDPRAVFSMQSILQSFWR